MLVIEQVVLSEKRSNVNKSPSRNTKQSNFVAKLQIVVVLMFCQIGGKKAVQKYKNCQSLWESKSSSDPDVSSDEDHEKIKPTTEKKRKQDLDKLLQDARDVGVKKIIVVPEFLSDFQRTIDIVNKYKDFIYPCLGIHPVQEGNRSVSLADYQVAEEWIRKYSSLICGIGEIGLDFTPRYIKSPDDKEAQREVFSKQIKLAMEFDLPVNVHSRSASRPVIDLLVQNGATKVLLHAFDGRPSNALRGIEAGFYFSFPPCIVRSEQKQKLAKIIPLSNMILETDAPALGPEKQERNVPANIHLSCKEIAKIKEITVEEVIKTTTENAERLFSRCCN